MARTPSSDTPDDDNNAKGDSETTLGKATTAVGTAKTELKTATQEQAAVQLTPLPKNQDPRHVRI